MGGGGAEDAVEHAGVLSEREGAERCSVLSRRGKAE